MKMKIDTPQMTLWKIEELHNTPPHIHEQEFQITVPIYGSCLFVGQHRAYELASSEGFVQYPEVPHELHVSEGSGVIVLQVNRGSFAEFTKQRPLELDMRQQIDPAELNVQFRKWVTALLLGQTEPLAVQETETQVLYFLSRVLKGNQTNKRDAALASAAVADRYMTQVLDYMHEHFTDKINIDTLAAIALQSRYHFIRSFKSILGMTPYQYMLALRVEEAKSRLGRSEATVTEISFRLGFSSTSQFYRVFAKTVGVTPEQYRSGLRR
ncbi:AraC family transcriptional regulator [Paenibacillus ginsengarvi]|uniref:AraC family transcriptional regulator n=1 Tax=Paenibacillus ginsengarvi TaxID=400777 RepID=A0A3B0CJM0_9BACL|nr:AraC family transcriptional regulator [Paenibacillus ginsengarvi]RKN85220.1 AraC family transcriptional regulator [Paenibacillus ginsengarvi]